MLSLILFYGTFYLVIGFVSAWLINQAIITANQDDPYSPGEIALAILLWPVNLTIFITSFLISLFR